MPKYGGSLARRKRTRRHILAITALIASVLVGGGALASNALQSDGDETQAIADDTLNSARLVGTPEPTPDQTKRGWRPIPRPRPTPTPTPTPTAEPEPEATESASPEPEPTEEPQEEQTQEPPEPEDTSPDYGTAPNADTTGVPAGTELKPSDSITITKDGTVIDALEIRGTVLVRADDVTIKRSRIDNTGTYPIQLEPGHRNLVVEDTEIDGNGKANVAILHGEYTLRRVDIHSVLDGPRIEGDNVLIEDSYIHDLHRVEGGHHDAIQVRKGRNITIRGNNLQAYNAETGDPMNAAIQFGSLNGTLDGLVAEGNLMNGGNFTINAVKLDGGSVIFRDNRFGRDFRYGVVSGGPGLEWASSNVFDDNGKPVD